MPHVAANFARAAAIACSACSAALRIWRCSVVSDRSKAAPAAQGIPPLIALDPIGQGVVKALIRNTGATNLSAYALTCVLESQPGEAPHPFWMRNVYDGVTTRANAPIRPGDTRSVQLGARGASDPRIQIRAGIYEDGSGTHLRISFEREARL
ncbi:MAG TPA: hypothetical protein VNH18_26030 [Bryobacteraceae bacterium]|nr:hypothetical protein [Bryobacteraceae bacterium]